MKTRITLDRGWLLALALVAGCSDAGPPAPSAPAVADGRIPVFAAAGPGLKGTAAPARDIRDGATSYRGMLTLATTGNIAEPHAGLATLASLM